MSKRGNTTKRDVNFLFEMGSIRFINRMWRRFFSPKVANLAEHHFRVFWIAMVIAAREGGVDTGKMAKMVMVHDIAESRAGDVDYLARQYVERNQELGIQDMLGETAIEKEFLELWEEYEERNSMEAKIIKDADNLDIDMELAEQAAMGNKGLQETFIETRQRVREILFTETAKEMFDEIKVGNPHNWHKQGRNRLQAGDWKK